MANLLQCTRPARRLWVKGWIQWCLSTTVWDRLRWNSSCELKGTPWAFATESSSSNRSLNSSSGWSDVVRRQERKHIRRSRGTMGQDVCWWSVNQCQVCWSYMASKHRWPSCLSRVWRNGCVRHEVCCLQPEGPHPLETWPKGIQEEVTCCIQITECSLHSLFHISQLP